MTHRCPPVGVQQGGLHPRRRARHQHGDQGVVLRHPDRSKRPSAGPGRTRPWTGRRRCRPGPRDEAAQGVPDDPSVLRQPRSASVSGCSMRSTTIGRIGVCDAATAVARAMSTAVCSTGESGRPKTVSASAAIRSRRRAVTIAAHATSSTPDGRGPSSSGFRRGAGRGRARSPGRRPRARPGCARPSGRPAHTRGGRRGSSGCRATSPEWTSRAAIAGEETLGAVISPCGRGPTGRRRSCRRSRGPGRRTRPRHRGHPRRGTGTRRRGWRRCPDGRGAATVATPATLPAPAPRCEAGTSSLPAPLALPPPGRRPALCAARHQPRRRVPLPGGLRVVAAVLPGATDQHRRIQPLLSA